jgi:EAL domain-containing protein (putative c-di-GMP-specific phosphodiesterase class I)
LVAQTKSSQDRESHAVTTAVSPEVKFVVSLNRFIQALKELGCKFALDDFGTGLSSFGYLKHFPVDYLKIDGSFVREILRDPIDREMVRSINEIGHLTGKQTIAEFAENAEIIQMLTSLGVDFAQGYGVAQPQRVLKAAVA